MFCYRVNVKESNDLSQTTAYIPLTLYG